LKNIRVEKYKMGDSYMTQEQLNQLYYLNKEINMHEVKLKELEECGYKSPVISPSPCGTQMSDLTGSIAIDRIHYQQLLKECLEIRTVQRGKIVEYINSIEDTHIRKIFHLRHVEGKAWKNIGVELNYSLTGAYMRYKRYLEKCEKCENTNVI
jgi:hypothetical protein